MKKAADGGEYYMCPKRPSSNPPGVHFPVGCKSCGGCVCLSCVIASTGLACLEVQVVERRKR